MKLRSQIDNNYKWEIEGFPTEKEINKAFDAIQTLIEELPKFNGKFNNPDELYKYFHAYQKQEILISKFANYIYNMRNVDNSDIKYLKLISKFEILYSKLDELTAFIEPQLTKLPESYLKGLLKLPKFKDYNNTIENIIKQKPHHIDEKTNETISKFSNVLGKNRNIFETLSNSEMKFEDAVDSKGKKYKMDNAVYPKYVSSKDKVLRKSAWDSMMNAFGNFNKTFASLYLKDIEEDKVSSKIHKFKSVLDEELYSDDIPKQVFDNVIKYVDKNLKLLQRYVKAFAKSKKIKPLDYYDLFIDDKVNGKITIEQAHRIILNALAPIGEEYVEKVKYKLQDKSIDYLPNQNKRSGAYCSNCYDAKTLILLNYTDDFDSVNTLIHEMGHCINAEYFNTAQPYTKADISIFCAEIASTVNEILLNQYMLKTCTPKQRNYYLNDFLSGVKGTIFTQILYTKFELFAHENVENNQPITYQDLNKKYLELNKQFYGNSCKIPTNIQYCWSRIPHFYSAYYVYCYATGLISAINIANKILNEKDYAKKYIYFLKNGTNKKPMDILKEIDIDLTTDTPYIEAFKFIEKQLKDYEATIK